MAGRMQMLFTKSRLCKSVFLNFMHIGKVTQQELTVGPPNVSRFSGFQFLGNCKKIFWIHFVSVFQRKSQLSQLYFIIAL